MMHKTPKLLVRNMVCQRCVLTVEQILEDLNLPFRTVMMGEVELERTLSAEELRLLESALSAVGFAVIETRMHKIIDDIKRAVLDYLAHESTRKHKNLSSFIVERVPNDYSYLSDLFSSVEGKTIEQFFILQRLEKVKELLVYDQLSLTQIAHETGFSSVHHLSGQFKKITGLTPSDFKSIAGPRRRGLDQI